MEIKEIGVIDLFCGVGGLTHGFVLEGYEVIAGIDLDDSCSYAYEKKQQSKISKAGCTEIKIKRS